MKCQSLFSVKIWSICRLAKFPRRVVKTNADVLCYVGHQVSLLNKKMK